MLPGPLQTIEEWLTLPELQVSDNGAEYYFLKLGMLRAARHQALAAGVVEPWSPPEDGPAASIVILGTATIETAEEPQLLRLPNVLAEWAFEMVALAFQGVKVFPRRVWLRAVQDGIEVEPHFDAPLSLNDTAPLMASIQHDDKRRIRVGVSVGVPALDGREAMCVSQEAEHGKHSGVKGTQMSDVLTVYVDESGNTGDAATGSAKDFGGQRVFTLVGVGDDAGPGSIEEILSGLRRKHGVRAEEIKSRTMDRYPAFVDDLVRHISSRNSIFVEIMDKKFYLATNLVTFALRGPRFDLARDVVLANQFANIVTDIVDDTALVAYGNFAKVADRQSFEFFEDAFRRGLLRAKLISGPHQERDFRLIERIEAAFNAALVERGTSDYLSFLPPPDAGPNRQRIPMLPHVQAFCHLLARMNRHAHAWSSVRVIHDQQAQFDVVLRHAASFLQDNALQIAEVVQSTRAESHADWALASGKFQLTFSDSKAEPGIQVADVIARLCTRRMNAVLAKASPDASYKGVFRVLGNLGCSRSGLGVNVVTTKKVVEEFWAG